MIDYQKLQEKFHNKNLFMKVKAILLLLFFSMYAFCQERKEDNSNKNIINKEYFEIEKVNNKFQKSSAKKANTIRLSEEFLYIEIIEPIEYKIKRIVPVNDSFKITFESYDFYYIVSWVDKSTGILKWDNYLQENKKNNDLSFYAIDKNMISKLSTNLKDAKANNNDCEINNLSKLFKFSISFLNENAVQIKIQNKIQNKIQLINHSLRVESKTNIPCKSISYLNNNKIQEGIETYNSFILSDFNFDGLEDFAYLNDFGGNAGPFYSYYIQNKNKKFEYDVFLSEKMGYFPSKIDKVNKILTISHPNGCCEVQTIKYKFISDKWSLIESKFSKI